VGLQTVVLQYNSPNQPLGIQIKPRGSKSSPRNPNQALEVQIEPQGSKSSPGGPNQALEVQIKAWSQNGSSRLQADKQHHSGRVPGAGEILGNLGGTL
jgi:hypothetical protein